MPTSETREIWDLYDRERNIIGEIYRGKRLPPGTYHLVVCVWVVTRDGRLLLTLRSPDKESWPGYWENEGGSALQGENSMEAVLRELYEETGIEAIPSEMRHLASETVGNSLYDHYAVYRDAESTVIRLQEGETVDSKWVTPEELEAMIQEGLLARPVAEEYSRLRPQLMGLLRAQSVLIRPAREEDAAVLWRMAGESFAYNPTLYETTKRLRKALEAPENTLLVAQWEGETAGYAHYCAYHGLLTPPMALLMELAVLPEYQRQSIGKALLDEVECRARKQGAEGIFLFSGIDREGAHTFYEAQGYTMRKLQKNYIKFFRD